MDRNVMNIITDKVAIEWKKFARGTNFSEDVDVIVDQIDHDENMTGEKSKIKCFLTKLYERHPNDYRTFYEKSLKAMGRNDVLQDISSIGAFLTFTVYVLIICKKNFFHYFLHKQKFFN